MILGEPWTGLSGIVNLKFPPSHSSLSQKARYDFSQPYPFILVNVGSGVSVLAVHGPDNYKRISGTRWV